MHRDKEFVETAKSMVAEATLPQIVQIEFRVLDAPGGRVRLEGDTNLPVGTHLMLLVTSKLMGQKKGSNAHYKVSTYSTEHGL